MSDSARDHFIAKDNICGQTLLRLSARGSSLIAELFRLSANIPPPFLPNPDGSPNNSVESKLPRLSYIRKPEYYVLIVSLNIRELPLTKHGPVAAHVTASPSSFVFLSLSRLVPDVAARPFPLPSFGAFRQNAGIVLFRNLYSGLTCLCFPPPPLTFTAPRLVI